MFDGWWAKNVEAVGVSERKARAIFVAGMRAALDLAYKGCAWCDCVHEIETELTGTATESEPMGEKHT